MTLPARLRDLFAPQREKPFVVFDFDDTLVTIPDTYFEICFEWIYNQSRHHGTPFTFEEVRHISMDSYRTHGNGLLPFRDAFGWGDEMMHRFIDETAATYLNDIDQHVEPQPATAERLHRLNQRTSGLAILTSNTSVYALTALKPAGLTSFFDPDMVKGRSCIGHYFKTDVRSYQTFRRTVTAHLPETTPHIMVEDTAANLPAAKHSGWVTVLLGNRPVSSEFADHIDFRFPTLHDAMDEMLAER